MWDLNSYFSIIGPVHPSIHASRRYWLFIMKACSMALIAIIACLATSISRQNYIGLSRSDPNFVVFRKTNLDQGNNDERENNMPMPRKRYLPLKETLRQELLESLVPIRKAYSYHINDIMRMPCPTAQKRPNYARLAKKPNYIRLSKKGNEYGGDPDLYDDL